MYFGSFLDPLWKLLEIKGRQHINKNRCENYHRKKSVPRRAEGVRPSPAGAKEENKGKFYLQKLQKWIQNTFRNLSQNEAKIIMEITRQSFEYHKKAKYQNLKNMLPCGAVHF